MVRALLFIQSVLLLVPDAVLGVRTGRLAAPPHEKQLANKTQVAAAHAVDDRLTPDGSAPVMVVEEIAMPVMVVVVGNADAVAKSDASSDAAGISASCQQELLAVKKNQTRIAEAEACERGADHTQQAVTALQQADTPAALTTIEGAYHKCMGLTKSCAREVAPQLVHKLRLSGMTITKECGKVAEEASTDGSEVTNECQNNMTGYMIRELKSKNIDGMMEVARHGLNSCNQVKHPCDFQLAPMLVMQLIQMAMGQRQQQITEVLLAGLHQAEELEENMINEEVSKRDLSTKATQLKFDTASKQAEHDGSKAVHTAPDASNKLAIAKTVQKKKVLSLLSLDDRLHVMFKRQALML